MIGQGKCPECGCGMMEYKKRNEPFYEQGDIIWDCGSVSNAAGTFARSNACIWGEKMRDVGRSEAIAERDAEIERLIEVTRASIVLTSFMHRTIPAEAVVSELESLLTHGPQEVDTG